MDAHTQREQLTQIMIEEDLHLSEVWLRYFSLGGEESEEQLMLYTVAEVQLREGQRDLVSIALRELVSERHGAAARRTTQ
ncbi:hypothetical protein [Arthrobacter sp. B0490]|uniref:hypothetical protein n=1 Tax=Arthrobacter sp. B0490 TaxID=2058891 RepID=UPI000CE3E026|nr:hypothetical protein [Arthrobacter sp. B0490]